MTAGISDQLRLTGDQLRVLTPRIGADYLRVGPAPQHHRTIDRREAALEKAARELLSRNVVLDDGTIHPDLVPVLLTLQRPDRELAIRLVSSSGIARISAARRDTLCVIARQIRDETTLRIIGHSIELARVISALLAELPCTKAAEIQSLAAPLQQMAQSLSDGRGAAELADQFRALGADTHTAMLLGSALASREAFAELVYSTLERSQDRIRRAPAAVALMYTKRGRIIGAPSRSPTGQLWTTLKPGSDHAISQAIVGLIELTEYHWDPS